MQNYNNMEVYQKAFSLSSDVFQEIKDLKYFRVRDQIIGSTTAICANLAEMAGFDHINQRRQKLRVCIGETNETTFWLNFLKKNKMVAEERGEKFLDEIRIIRIMLCKYLNALPRKRESEKA